VAWASNVLAVVVALSLAFLALSRMRSRYRSQVVRRWPRGSATVETITYASRGHYTYVYVVEVNYSYTVDGAFYSGEAAIPGTWWRTPPTDQLVGRTIQVCVNPKDPSESVIVSASLPGLEAATCPPFLGIDR